MNLIFKPDQWRIYFSTTQNFLNFVQLFSSSGNPGSDPAVNNISFPDATIVPSLDNDSSMFRSYTEYCRDKTIDGAGWALFFTYAHFIVIVLLLGILGNVINIGVCHRIKKSRPPTGSVNRRDPWPRRYRLSISVVDLVYFVFSISLPLISILNCFHGTILFNMANLNEGACIFFTSGVLISGTIAKTITVCYGIDVCVDVMKPMRRLTRNKKIVPVICSVLCVIFTVHVFMFIAQFATIVYFDNSRADVCTILQSHAQDTYSRVLQKIAATIDFTLSLIIAICFVVTCSCRVHLSQISINGESLKRHFSQRGEYIVYMYLTFLDFILFPYSVFVFVQTWSAHDLIKDSLLKTHLTFWMRLLMDLSAGVNFIAFYVACAEHRKETFKLLSSLILGKIKMETLTSNTELQQYYGYARCHTSPIDGKNSCTRA